MKLTSLLLVSLLGVTLPALRAADNLLSPLAAGSARAGDSVSSPWTSSDASDDGLVSVKLGSPDGGKADWAELRDDSPVNTANLRCLKLDPVTRGEFAFEIQIGDGADGVVAVSLGIDGVTDIATRVLTCRFSPDGGIQLSSHDSGNVRASQNYSFGTPQTYRLKFDTDDGGTGVAQLFEGKGTSPIAELKTPAALVPITGVRVTTGQKNSHVQAYVRDLVLEKN